MNLVTDKWIPVIGIDGKPDYASLMEVFTAGEKYADLSVRPHERVALMRLLICIAQAALDGPKNDKEWQEASKKLPEAAKAYLEKGQGSFNLFDSRKLFLQIADLELIPKKKKEGKKKPKTEEVDEESSLTPLSKMEFALATGNNSTLFDHEANSGNERQFPPRQIALMLLTFQCFSPGGGLPIAQWKNVKTKQVGNPDSLCITGGMYHTFIRATTLKQTICLNLLTKDAIVRHYGKMNGNNPWGKPVLELFPSKPDDDSAVKNATKTYLGRLVPLCRWVRITSGRTHILCGKGFEYPVLERKIKRNRKTKQPELTWPAEPTASVRVIDKKDGSQERVILGAKPDKAIWRELAALLIQRNDEGIGGPLVFQNPLPNNGFDIHVCALMRDQASPEQAMESVFSINKRLFSEEGRSVYEEEVGQTEELSWKLGYAVETYRRNVDNGWDARCEAAGRDKNTLKRQLHSIATRSYWTAVEKCRHLLMAHIDAFGTDQAGPTQKTWRSAVHKAAREAYAAACGRETPRQIRAFALGRKKFFAESKSEDKEEQETGGEE